MTDGAARGTPPIGGTDYARAVLNMLEDSAEERDRSREAQRAIANILEDYGEEKEQMVAVHRATMNILEDFAAEKQALERMKLAVLNVLEDLALEKSRLDRSLHEKEVLLREVHHRVKNNLQLIASLLNLQARHLRDEGSRALIEESQTRVQSIALVHETLYQSGDLASVDLGAYLHRLVEHLWESWIGIAGRISISIEAPRLHVSLDVAIPCGLIVNELVTNALKHGFPGERRGSVRVSVRETRPSRVVLTVADDGVGMPARVGPGHPGGLGTELVATLARQLRGAVSIASRPGTTVELALELPARQGPPP